MKLERYLSEKSIGRSDFAARIGVNASTITRLIDGTRRPSGALLALIEEKTDGAVGFRDFDWQAPEEGAAA